MVTRKCTTQLLQQLRLKMQDVKYVKEPLQAYIVPWADAHNSEYVADCDQQRAFISGFTGSAGTAVVTLNDARLWTDGRYYLQASQELDSNWTLMKESLPTTPSQATWLSKNLPAGSRVGVDPSVINQTAWKSMHDQLTQSGLSLVGITENLVNLIWPDRPARPNKKVHLLPDKLNGKSVSQKLADVRAVMDQTHASTLVLTSLDEIAWFFNLRGSDLGFCPVFFAYAVVMRDFVALLTGGCAGAGAKVDEQAVEHLKEQVPEFQLLPYADAKMVLERAVESEGKVWLSGEAPHALVKMVPDDKLILQVSLWRKGEIYVWCRWGFS